MADKIDYGYETWSEKFKRKFNENPWVPIGCVATTGALIMSAVKMKAGKSKDMQYWLRARVGLQGLTLVALVAGSMALKNRKQKQLAESDVSDDLPRNEATTELRREQKKGKEKAEFEERLRNAEMTHEEEQAAAHLLKGAKISGGSASVDEPNVAQKAAEAPSTKTNSSWTRWFGWGSSKSDQAESSKKS
ncbi:Respiratory supercomplex factor 1, mitochondrial [Leucoagaricus sp. SymC.cos]|nr:Respiratory supercomplex factor 1, mitochondrial [Leucoagaricus sp. SymC.cos]